MTKKNLEKNLKEKKAKDAHEIHPRGWFIKFTGDMVGKLATN